MVKHLQFINLPNKRKYRIPATPASAAMEIRHTMSFFLLLFFLPVLPRAL